MRSFIVNKKLLLITMLGIVVVYLCHFQEDSQALQNQVDFVTLTNQRLYSDQAITPIPLSNLFDKNKAILGDKLFHDPRLSKNNSVACASCHSLFTAGADRLTVSIGINGLSGQMNAPTVFNSGFNFSQFWDGRTSSLEEQVAGPIKNNKEMATSWQEILPKLNADKFYPTAFNQLYVDGITAKNVANAIAEFERSLTTPNSLFDQYLRGNKKALSTDALLGYQKFVDYGCVSCHQGVNIGGNMFQKFGVMDDYFADKNDTVSNLGRYNVTKQAQDKHVFKVPSLRNVAVTGPYLHDGSIKSLSETISIMGYYQLGQQLTDTDIAQLRSFLESLTGEWQGERLK